MTAYSGMRSSEVHNLKFDCLRIERGKHGDIYRLEGTTTKNFGYMKTTSWVTTAEISDVFNVAQMIATLGNAFKNLPVDDLPLFLYVGFINFGYNAFMSKSRNLVCKNDYTLQGCLLYTSPSPRDLSTSRMPSSA